MSSRSYHTSPADPWTTDILPRLPPDLASQARALGAFQRQRAFASPAHLLRGLLAYALDHRSLRQLGIWGVLSGVADLAPSSWLHRLRTATPWLRWLCQHLLAAPLRPRFLSQRLRSRLLVVDATTLGLAHGPADAYRLHLAYDLLAGQLDQLHLTERSAAETLAHFHFAPGDIIVADSGYDAPADFAVAHRQGAQVVTRVYLPTLPLQRRDGQPLALLPWLERAGPQSLTLSTLAQLVVEEQVIPVRVIAARLPRDQRRAAERRYRGRARRKGRVGTPLGLLLASWLVLVTTLEQDSWTAEEVVELYRLRWQVELRIKRLKQLVTGSRLRARTTASAQGLLWAQLVGWALHEPTARELRAPLEARGKWGQGGKEQEETVRSWQVSVLVLETLRQAIRGQWDAARVEECLPRLRRYLVERLRWERGEQEVLGAAWLRGQRAQPRRSSG